MTRTLKENVIYSVTLRPNRLKLGKHAIVIIAVFLFFSIAFGLFFTLIGGWIVLPFFAVDIALLFACLWWNQRTGHQSETIDITDSQMLIRKVDHRGRTRQLAFPIHWLQINLTMRHPQRDRLEIRTHGRSAYIGDFLSTDERSALAAALQRVLAKSWKPASLTDTGSKDQEPRP